MRYLANPVEADAEIIIDIGPIESDGSMEITLQGGRRKFHLDKGMIARHIPQPGDYLVTQCADGYTYVNPKDVFERKYSAKEA